jgi:hypothetical protein
VRDSDSYRGEMQDTGAVGSLFPTSEL